MIRHNHARSCNFFEAGRGGGLSYTGFQTDIQNNIISENMADVYGGGIYIRVDFEAGHLNNNLISNNFAIAQGGGVHITCCQTPIISMNSIINNTVQQEDQGGGVFCDWEACPINNNNIYGNLSGISANIPNDLTNGNIAGIPDLNAENNFWGTTDLNAIEDRIRHFIDDGNLAFVDYIPPLTQPIQLSLPLFTINYSSGAPGSFYLTFRTLK